MVGEIRLLREVAFGRAVVHFRGCTGTAGVLPFSFGRQSESSTGSLGEPAAESVRLVPRNVCHRLVGRTERKTAFAYTELQKVAMFNATVVAGIEQRILRVGNLFCGNPKRTRNCYIANGPLIKVAVIASHFETAHRYSNHINRRQLRIVTQRDFYPCRYFDIRFQNGFIRNELRSTCRDQAFGFFRRNQRLDCSPADTG